MDGDEEDGMDEGGLQSNACERAYCSWIGTVIVSCDGKMLVDDELHDILVEPLPPGCHLTVSRFVSSLAIVDRGADFFFVNRFW